MLSSLFAGISGLNANSNAMAVIGDNIANVNTAGFKSSRVSFANILSQSQGGYTGNEIGRGVSMTDISAQMTQGSLETTENATDLAIQGSGFFMLKNDNGAKFYTRAGEFKFNKEGQLIDNNGYKVQGWDLDTVAGVGGVVTDIVIPNGGTTAAEPTTEFTVQLNLDAGAAVGDEYSTSLTVYDSLGNEVDLTILLTRSAAGWDWTASIPATSGTATGAGTLTFNSDGSLSNGSDDTIDLALLTGATTPQAITWDLYDDAAGAAHTDVTGYSAPSATTFMNQDGFSAGTLQSVNIDEQGTITGVYSNGQTKALYQISLAAFPSYWGLTKKGGNLYTESLSSGQPLIGVAGSGVVGSIISKSIEMSNVDLAAEFVNLITTQRAFQANSKVITASDEILTDLINIKR